MLKECVLIISIGLKPYECRAFEKILCKANQRLIKYNFRASQSRCSFFLLNFNFYVIICLGDNMDSTNYTLGRKISFDLFRDELIKGQYMYENNFYIDGIDKYNDCWIGFNDQFEEPYWFGITPDGNNAYEYNTADEILNAKVFDGKSMYELWDKVYFYSLNGVDVLEWIWYDLKFYYCRKQDAYNVAKLAVKLWNDDYDKLKTEFEELVQTENNRVYTAYYLSLIHI